MHRNPHLVGAITGYDFGGDGRRSWSQNVGCRVRKVFKVVIDNVWPVIGRIVVGKRQNRRQGGDVAGSDYGHVEV